MPIFKNYIGAFRSADWSAISEPMIEGSDGVWLQGPDEIELDLGIHHGRNGSARVTTRMTREYFEEQFGEDAQIGPDGRDIGSLRGTPEWKQYMRDQGLF